MIRYVEDPSLASSSTAQDDPVIPGTAPPSTNALVAIVEQGMGGMAYDERVRIGLVSVVPVTGDVVWDEFDGEIWCYFYYDGIDHVVDTQSSRMVQILKSEQSSKLV